MSLFGPPSPNQIKPSYTGLQLNTSTGVLPVPIVYGQQRTSANLIWYGDWKQHSVGLFGKGGGKSGQYDYTASIMLALSEGPIHACGIVWANGGFYNHVSDLGFSLATGTTPQAPWGYLTTHHPSQALNYAGIAYVAEA